MFTFRVDATGEKEFNRTLNEYRRWHKNQPSEIVNGKLYFISLQAMKATKTGDPAKIKSKLEAPSRDFIGAPLAAILVNSQLGQKHKKGLTGEKMKIAVEKFIRKSQARIHFLQSGWLPALKILDYWNKRNQDNLKFTKRYAPKRPQGVRQYGKDKGIAIYAKPDRAYTYGSITNGVGQVGKQRSPTVVPIIEAGLKAGIRAEIASMRVYIEKKFKDQFDKMKRTGKV